MPMPHCVRLSLLFADIDVALSSLTDEIGSNSVEDEEMEVREADATDGKMKVCATLGRPAYAFWFGNPAANKYMPHGGLACA